MLPITGSVKCGVIDHELTMRHLHGAGEMHGAVSGVRRFSSL
jgi:hypothetical protein